jgi:hypothetical protein
MRDARGNGVIGLDHATLDPNSAFVHPNDVVEKWAPREAGNVEILD